MKAKTMNLTSPAFPQNSARQPLLLISNILKKKAALTFSYGILISYKNSHSFIS